MRFVFNTHILNIYIFYESISHSARTLKVLRTCENVSIATVSRTNTNNGCPNEKASRPDVGRN